MTSRLFLTLAIALAAGPAFAADYQVNLGPMPLDDETKAVIAGRDEATLTTGFVVSGGTKNVLVRAIGPSLAQFGVSDFLAEPTLTLRPLGSETIVARSTRWGGTSALRAAFAATGAFPLPDTSADSALLTALAPGAYTAQASGVNGTTGVALIEAYDADAPSIARLANTSVRARVGVDDQILIPGLSIGGDAPRTVLIRAAGPALTALGVPGALSAPVLKVLSGQTELASNQAWGSAPNLPELRAALIKTGAFAFTEGSLDCALLVTLAPGGYTIQVSGAGRTSGVALVEVYDVP